MLTLVSVNHVESHILKTQARQGIIENDCMTHIEQCIRNID